MSAHKVKPEQPDGAPRGIGTLNEKPLHAALKQWYAEPGDQLEVRVEGYTIDIVRGELLVEIQTKSLSALKRKLVALTEQRPVRLVYPVAQDKWIKRLPPDGKGRATRRKSPQHGTIESVFEELVSLPKLMASPNLQLEVLLIQEEETRRYEGVHSRRSWRRRGWVTHERKLLQVLDRRLFETPADLATLLPAGLPEPFTTKDLAEALSPRATAWLAQKMAYCLREMGAIVQTGKRGNSFLYVRADSAGTS